MRKGEGATNPAEWLSCLSGWQRDLILPLREAIHAAATFGESVKWTNLLLSHEGPCLVIRSEDARVILAFFRGKRLVEHDPRVKPSGKFELGNIILREGDDADTPSIVRLAVEAAALNDILGSPTRRH